MLFFLICAGVALLVIGAIVLSSLRSSPPATRVAATAATAQSGGQAISYRTRDGQADYRFSFQRQGDGLFRIYILSQPSYGSRDTSMHATHRLNDGRLYICWAGAIRTTEQARWVAATWADSTQNYIRTGRTF